MNDVVKIILINDTGKYLLLYRNNHPTFGDDADLPGGGAEDGESTVSAVLRELQEETGIQLQMSDVVELCASSSYSTVGKTYILYQAKLPNTPTITISWEHARYVWLQKEDFMHAAANAKDSYMHMVADALNQ